MLLFEAKSFKAMEHVSLLKALLIAKIAASVCTFNKRLPHTIQLLNQLYYYMRHFQVVSSLISVIWPSRSVVWLNTFRFFNCGYLISLVYDNKLHAKLQQHLCKRSWRISTNGWVCAFNAVDAIRLMCYCINNTTLYTLWFNEKTTINTLCFLFNSNLALILEHPLCEKYDGKGIKKHVQHYISKNNCKYLLH